MSNVQLMLAEFEKVIGEYRIAVDYRTYRNPVENCWSQAFAAYYCDASAEYVEGSYSYPWNLAFSSTAHADDLSVLEITKEKAELAIEATYRELTLTPEQRKARHEKSEQLKAAWREKRK